MQIKFKSVSRFLSENILLIIIILLGGLFRFYNLNWDNYGMFHPDERNIANAVSQIDFFSQLNPHFFAYGGLTIYLYRALGELVSLLTRSTIWVHDWGHINLVGRSVVATFSTATTFTIYLLAKKVFGKKEALLASLFFVFTPISIQIAHFAITETFLAFFVLILCLLCIKLFETKKSIFFTTSAIVTGLAIATKTTALSFGLIQGLTILLLILKGGRHKKKILHYTLYLLYFVILASIIFFIFSPYTILSFDKFMESMHYESGVALGTIPVPYTLQFDKTLPYVFQIQGFLWDMGIITVFSFIGFFLCTYGVIRRKKATYLIFLIFPTFYFLYVGSWHTKFIRFMLPIIPFLLILASYALFKIRDWNKIVGNILIVLSALVTILWGCAFFSIYLRPQTKVTASEWIYKHIAPGSKILGEHWDDGLPLTIKDNVPSIYSIEQLKIYDADNTAKIQYYADELSGADYIIINSRRLYGTLLHLPEKYPITQKYYQLLFAGKLGYKKVAEFSSYPSFFGVTINDDASEESFQVYDHTKVIILKNQKHYSAKKLMDILSHK